MRSATFDGPTVPQSIINDGDIRVVFKIYFIVVILFIAFLGSYGLKFYIRRQLLKGRPVGLATTTGWIHGLGLAKTAYELRRIPGGWFGFIMFLATALEIISDFGVAKTITLVQKQTRTTSPAVWQLLPRSIQRTIKIELSWNRTELASNSPYGIYRFINGYDVNFLAMPEDIIGYWSCLHDPKTPIVYNQTFQKNATQIWDFDVGTDLIKRGLLYGGSAQVNNVSIFNDTYQGPSFQLVIWSASNYTRGSVPSFTFAVETSALDDYGSKQMDVFNCSLHSTGPRETVIDILRNIDIMQTMAKFSTPITGALYPSWWAYQSYDLTTLASTVEYYLNAVIMVAGSGQQTDTPNAKGYTYGVLEYATVIPYWITAITVVTFTLALFMVCLVLFLWLSNQKLVHAYKQKDLHRVSTKQIADNTPVGLLGWMSYATAASRNTENPEEEGLQKFILSTTWHGDVRLGVVKAEEHGLSNGEMKKEGVYVGGKT